MSAQNNPRHSAALLASVSALLASGRGTGQDQDAAPANSNRRGRHWRAHPARQDPGFRHRPHQRVLEESHVFTVNEALRKVPGVFTRDEEGFGCGRTSASAA